MQLQSILKSINQLNKTRSNENKKIGSEQNTGMRYQGSMYGKNDNQGDIFYNNSF